jgi:hypothetical protein
MVDRHSVSALTERTIEMNEYEPNNTDGTTPREPVRRSKIRLWLKSKKNRWITSSALVVGLIGTSVGLATTSSTTAAPAAASSSTSATGATGSATAAGKAIEAGFGSGKGKSNARSAPAEGGTTGVIDTVSVSGFTLTTPAGQKVTISETSSTAYQSGTNSTSASALQAGDDVLVLGITNSTKISASEVMVQTARTSTSSTAKTVIPFVQGKPSAETKVGTIPANWSAGQGTLMSGTVANEASEAALAAYPGGVVDRVVKLSDGDYNVHFIGVNWPHHVFLNSNFKVIGAE